MRTDSRCRYQSTLAAGKSTHAHARDPAHTEYLEEPSDWATKWIARGFYAGFFALGVAIMALSNTQLVYILPHFAGLTAYQQCMLGVVFIAHGALLAAVAQANYSAQKLALVYNMIEIIIHAATHISFAALLQQNLYGLLAGCTVGMVGSIWLVSSTRCRFARRLKPSPSVQGVLRVQGTPCGKGGVATARMFSLLCRAF